MEIVVLSGFTKLLQDILGTLFDAVLSPVLRDAFNILVNIFGALISDIFSNFLLRLWIIFLKLVGFMESIFNVFSGISNVKVEDVSETVPLLEYFFRLDTIQKAFLAVTAVSVALAFLSTLLAVMKSMSDMALENRNPISGVLKQAAKAAVSFLVIPITCLFALQMCTKVVIVINTTFNYGSDNAMVSDALFITTAGPAAKKTGAVEDYSANQKYEDAEQVKKDFDISKISYVQAYVSTILIAIIMLCSILQFIQRIIVILLLYLVSPFFVSVMPLDGGARFREWKNMFAGYMISAFGPILSMKLYLLLVPAVSGNKINFGVSSGVMACVKLIFIVGGAFAVYKSRLLVISVVSPSVAGSMGESGMIASFLGGKAAGRLSSMARGGGRSVRRQSTGKASAAPGQASAASGQTSAASGRTESQAYTGR